MARQKPGGAGQLRGKIGDVVITKWKSKSIARDVPSKTTKRTTIPLKSHRTKFGKINKTLKRLQQTLTLGFASALKSMTGVNAAVKFNFKTLIIGDYPHYEIDYSSLMIANGKLDSVYDPEATLNNNGIVEIDWVLQINLKMGCNDNDQLCLQVVDTREKGSDTRL